MVKAELTHGSASPKSRPNPTVLLNDLRQPGKLLGTACVDSCVFLETLAVADKEESAAFYQRLPAVPLIA